MNLTSVFSFKIFLVLFLSLATLSVQSQSGKVKANGIEIAYETFGKQSDPKIILINGTGAPMTDWPLEFCEKLAKQGYQVVRFDNRDVGLSTKLDSLGKPNWPAIAPFIKTCKPAPLPYSLMDMVKDVTGLMDALKIDKAHIVGASMGGAIAQLLTIYYPARVLSLTSVCASSGDPGLPGPDPKALEAMSTPPPATTDKNILSDYLLKVWKTLGSTDDEATLRKRALTQIDRSWYPQGTTRQVAAIFIADNCDRRSDLAKITVPVLVIHGDSDPLVSIEAAKEINTAIPNSELQIVKGMGHDLSTGFIDQLASLVLKNAGKSK